MNKDVSISGCIKGNSGTCIPPKHLLEFRPQEQKETRAGAGGERSQMIDDPAICLHGDPRRVECGTGAGSPRSRLKGLFPGFMNPQLRGECGSLNGPLPAIPECCGALYHILTSEGKLDAEQ